MSAPVVDRPALAVVPEVDQPSDNQDNVRDIAQQFGQYIRHGGSWRYAVMVAMCCTSPGPGRMRTADKERGKVPVKDFAQLAGIDKDTVSAYLRAWELAAERGAVPSCTELDPSSEFELPEKLPEWSDMYRQANRKPGADKPKVASVGRSVSRAVKSLTEVDAERVAGMSPEEREAFTVDVRSLNEWAQAMIDVIESDNGG